MPHATTVRQTKDSFQNLTKMFTAGSTKNNKKILVSMEDQMMNLEIKRYITQPFAVDKSVARVLHSFVPQIHQTKWAKFQAKINIGDISNAQVKQEHRDAQIVLVSFEKLPANENVQMKITGEKDHEPGVNRSNTMHMDIPDVVTDGNAVDGNNTIQLENLENNFHVLPTKDSSSRALRRHLVGSSVYHRPIAHANNNIQMEIPHDATHGVVVYRNNTIQLETPADIVYGQVMHECKQLHVMTPVEKSRKIIGIIGKLIGIEINTTG